MDKLFTYTGDYFDKVGTLPVPTDGFYIFTAVILILIIIGFRS